MITILKKDHTRLRVKEVQLPITDDKILGTGIDATKLPDGHLSCCKCSEHRFECWIYLDAHRIELGCMKCGHSYRLLFPLDCPLVFRNQGRFNCGRHPDKGFVLIKSQETISFGCEKCYTEVDIKLKTKTNLILANG